MGIYIHRKMAGKSFPLQHLHVLVCYLLHHRGLVEELDTVPYGGIFINSLKCNSKEQLYSDRRKSNSPPTHCIDLKHFASVLKLSYR